MTKKDLNGVLALLLLSGIYVYRNRAAIQRYLDQLGIELPDWVKRIPYRSAS